jgi:hypothetical protein
MYLEALQVIDVHMLLLTCFKDARDGHLTDPSSMGVFALHISDLDSSIIADTFEPRATRTHLKRKMQQAFCHPTSVG